MALEKIFKPFNLSDIAEIDNTDFTDLLERSLCDYSFSVLWTRGVICNLNYLSGNRPPSTHWHPIISSPVSDNGGEITFRIGYFPEGTQINLSLGIQAVDTIPRLVLLITNNTERRVFKIPPGNQTKPMARGEFWQEVITITLP